MAPATPTLLRSEIQFDEGGVRLVIFHNIHASAQIAARVLSHTTAPVRSKFCLQDHACEGAGQFLCDCASCLLHQDMSLSLLLKNMISKPCLERHPEHEMSRYKHVRSQVSKQWHQDRCACNCSTFIAHVNQMHHIWHRAEACCVTGSRGV